MKIYQNASMIRHFSDHGLTLADKTIIGFDSDDLAQSAGSHPYPKTRAARPSSRRAARKAGHGNLPDGFEKSWLRMRFTPLPNGTLHLS